MRVNPRTVILKALQEGPRTRSDLWHEVFEHVMANGRQESCQQTDAVLARHLCHLTRSKQVVRLPDGRYATTRMVNLTATVRVGEQSIPISLRRRVVIDPAPRQAIDTTATNTIHVIGTCSEAP